MALGDYVLCEVCQGKAIYDGDYSLRDLWEEESVDFSAICGNCTKTHELIVHQKEQGEGQGDG